MAHGLCVAFSDINSTIWLVDDKLTMRVIRIQGVFLVMWGLQPVMMVSGDFCQIGLFRR